MEFLVSTDVPPLLQIGVLGFLVFVFGVFYLFLFGIY